jgi:nucleoside 2-deoxyribosyltransferase
VPNCVVCNTTNASLSRGSDSGTDFVRIECSRCGGFALSDAAEAALERETPLRKSVMSHTLRRMHLPGSTPVRVIKKAELPTFWQEKLPSPMQQADNLIRWIGDNQETPSTWVEGTQSAIAATIGLATSPNGDGPGFAWLNSQLEPKHLYRMEGNRQGGKLGIMLTMAGWEKYEALRKADLESRTAFMAMKFGDASVNRAVEECFRPAVLRTGFALKVLTDQQRAGSIDDQIRAGLLAARFVIADLTRGSHGAYWEAGFAEGRGVPVIYTCEKTDWDKNRTHFDTNHMVTIVWDAANMRKEEDALTATIRATLRADAKQTDE